jgi:hypothetical protein
VAVPAPVPCWFVVADKATYHEEEQSNTGSSSSVV